MKRFFDILKFIIAVIALVIFYMILNWFFKGSILIIVPVLAVVSLIAFALRKGKAMIVKERRIIECQLNSKNPVGFSKKRALFGYILMFSFLWILMSAVFLIPSSIAWVYILPPVIVVYIALCSIWKETWVLLGFKRRRYFLMHFLGVSIPLVLVLIIKVIILYIKYKNNQI